MMMKPIKTIAYSSHFERAIKKLPASLLKEAAKGERIFRRDCFDPRLHTHKLHGPQKDLWSFSLTYTYRIIFRFLSHDVAYFIDVGDHSIYQ